VKVDVAGQHVRIVVVEADRVYRPVESARRFDVILVNAIMVTAFVGMTNLVAGAKRFVRDDYKISAA
jgi:hypothetical protein